MFAHSGKARTTRKQRAAGREPSVHAQPPLEDAVHLMPYRSNNELPAPVRQHLPPTAQGIYREAFNHAWDTYADNPEREQIAHRVAWAAVKRRYYKQGDAWRQRPTREHGS